MLEFASLTLVKQIVFLSRARSYDKRECDYHGTLSKQACGNRPRETPASLILCIWTVAVGSKVGYIDHKVIEFEVPGLFVRLGYCKLVSLLTHSLSLSHTTNTDWNQVPDGHNTNISFHSSTVPTDNQT